MRLTRADLTERPVELVEHRRQLHLLQEEPEFEPVLIISGHELEARPEIVANVLGGGVSPGEYALQARGLLRIHGEHAILTADHDMKVDAERVSVG